MKTCPFCNGQPFIEHRSGSYGYTPGYWVIGCKSCGIEFKKDSEEWSQKRGHYSVSKEAKSWLVNKWDTRTEK